MRKNKLIILMALTMLLSSCGRAPEQPGDIPNPKLVELLNTSLNQQVNAMITFTMPGLLPQAADNTRVWLHQINEVVARCRYGPGNHGKRNLLEYDITLRSGEVLRDVFTGRRCLYPERPPLVMRVRFESGQVREVLTDGRERKTSPDAAMGEINQFAESVAHADFDRHPALYFRAAKTPEDIAREWETKP
jgi:hypothetical protein